MGADHRRVEAAADGAEASMTDLTTKVERQLDLIRAEAAYVRIAAAHRAAHTVPTVTELLAELRQCLPDMPVDRRIVATAAVLDRKR
jgi:hypothetical protein